MTSRVTERRGDRGEVELGNGGFGGSLQAVDTVVRLVLVDAVTWRKKEIRQPLTHSAGPRKRKTERL